MIVFKRANLSDGRRRDMVTESGSIPRKVTRWEGEMTFFPTNIKPEGVEQSDKCKKALLTFSVGGSDD